jgi:hypothetical protein
MRRDFAHPKTVYMWHVASQAVTHRSSKTVLNFGALYENRCVKHATPDINIVQRPIFMIVSYGSLNQSACKILYAMILHFKGHREYGHRSGT